MDRAVAWKLERSVGRGVEFVSVSVRGTRLAARGAAVRATPQPYRVEYMLRTGPEFVTRHVRVATEGKGYRRGLDLRRGHDGSWRCDVRTEGADDGGPPGCLPDELDGALDCDLALSPLTNTMPVLRHNLVDGGGPVDLLMAWISIPDLAVVPSRQRYEFVRRDGDRSVIRYSSPGTRSYEIVFDQDGLVVDYPGLARRVSD